jgi:hypothetical protein
VEQTHMAINFKSKSGERKVLPVRFM